MKILVIDDLRDTFNPPVTYIAKTFKDGLKQLRENRWDILYLDHDLGGKKTGYDILVNGFSENIIPPKVNLITMNIIGRQNMENVLKENGYDQINSFIWEKF